MEYLRQEFGKTKKQKFAPESVQEKLAKACRCSLSMPKGMHKDRCNVHPSNMRNLLRANVANRASMEAQLRPAPPSAHNSERRPWGICPARQLPSEPVL